MVEPCRTLLGRPQPLIYCQSMKPSDPKLPARSLVIQIIHSLNHQSICWNSHFWSVQTLYKCLLFVLGWERDSSMDFDNPQNIGNPQTVSGFCSLPHSQSRSLKPVFAPINQCLLSNLSLKPPWKIVGKNIIYCWLEITILETADCKHHLYQLPSYHPAGWGAPVMWMLVGL